MKPTQCERILWILGDGAEHEKSELYSFCVAHSRIAELRKRGCVIEYRRDGDRHLYRLVSLPTPAVNAGAGAAGAGSDGGVDDLVETSSGTNSPEDAPAQQIHGNSDGASLLVRRPLQLSLEAA